MNHIFVDFENVPNVDTSLIGTKSVNFTLLLGARQTKLDVGLVEKLMEHAASVQLVRLTSSSKNAVDFALAYYLGQAVRDDPTGYFHIISKDKGYEPLMDHLKSRHLHVRRYDSIQDLTFSAAAPAASTVSNDLVNRVLAHLRKNLNNRPKRKKTLASHLLAFAGKTANEKDIPSLIEKLRKAGHLSLNDKDVVTYSLK